MHYHRTFAASAAAAALITPLLAVSLPASAARQAPGTVAAAGHKHGRSATQTPGLPAPPRPPRSHPRLPTKYHNAQVNLAVTQGVASFFFHPTYPLSDLQQIVAGIKALGYTFVSPASLPG